MELGPNRSVVLVDRTGGMTLSETGVTKELVGDKAFGLLSIPAPWVPEFFVVSANAASQLESESERQRLLRHIRSAADLASVQSDTDWIVRSSASGESIADRGSLVSERTTASEVVNTVRRCVQQTQSSVNPVHWIVQRLVQPTCCGHLSNERRISEAKRDWLLEFEISDMGLRIDDPITVAVRKWRQGDPKKPAPLSCKSRIQIDDTAQLPARWATDLKLRLHFEWVWDGSTLWLVQADPCIPGEGVDPTQLLPKGASSIQAAGLKAFRLANSQDFEKYRKLGNAKRYFGLGYKPPSFYVLDDKDLIAVLLAGERTPELVADLTLLTGRPLVVRTDGIDIPPELKQMLPRSDELRDVEVAFHWLSRDLSQKLEPLKEHKDNIVLICHHFVPAVASAWCMADPVRKAVRIEALWGIPEGMYWYPHDVYELDTGHQDVDTAAASPERFAISKRLRYKELFVAPDEAGNWVTFKAAEKKRWAKTIASEKLLQEIAITSRRIAVQVGEPVNVMWFVGVHPDVCENSILPWFHEKSELDRSVLKGAPRFKRADAAIFELQYLTDWTGLKQADADARVRIKRIRVLPKDPELIRSKSFLDELSEFALSNDTVIELHGGVLSHVFYILQKAGCKVEVFDLYGIKDEATAFNKVVRDKIPEDIEKKGERVVQAQLSGDDLIFALKAKLIEEAYEALDASSTSETVAELADILEVVHAIASHLGVGIKAVQLEKKQKRLKRGGFDQGKVLLETANPQSLNPALAIEVADPTKKQTITLTETLPLDGLRRPGHTRMVLDAQTHQDERERDAGKEKLLEIEVPAVLNRDVSKQTEVRLTLYRGNAEFTGEFVGKWHVSRKKTGVRIRLTLSPLPIQGVLDY